MTKLGSMVMSLALALALSGCTDRTAQAQTHAGPAPNKAGASATNGGVGDDPSVPRLAVGTHAKCAVSGEDFVVDANTVQVTYAGKRYAFCCADCRPSFVKNPAKYAKQ
jgi:YHS domain-containing protein